MAKPASKPKRLTIHIERLIHDFTLCQQFGYPCRFTVGRATGYTPTVVKAMQERGYQVVKLRPRHFEITGYQPQENNSPQ